MGYWILKTEPSSYSFDQLERDGTTRWDGVKNPVALKHLARMRPGDEVLIYHTGADRAVVGCAVATSAGYPDPGATDPRWLAVDLQARGRLPRPVPLAAIKADPAFADSGLVRQGRLSVVPASEGQFRRLLTLAGG